MRLAPDRLNSWLNEHHFAAPPILDLAASTGPVWTFDELLGLGDPGERAELLAADLSYTHSAGGSHLRAALAAMAGVDPDQIQVTTGAAEALWIVFMLAAEPGVNAIVPQQPSFPLFNAAPPALGIEVRNYGLARDDGYRIDVDEIRRLVDRQTRFIVVNRPHNPTGAVVDDATLDAVHDLAVERGIQLVVDEVMHPIYERDAPASSSRLPGATVVGDFSKALCLSGLRLGWIVERDRRRRADYEQLRSSLTVSSSPISERLAVIAVRNREAIYERAAKTATAHLALFDTFMAEHADRIAWVRPAGGLTAFPWLRSGRNSRPFCREAAAAGVLLAPGDCFDAPEHFRVGFGAAGDRFRDGMERLADVVGTSRVL